ncbi:MAG: ATP-binding protein [Leptospiraceae bacterium]|nr:ATP-binding protein [Leptospiraceae bacterium]
MKKWGCNKCDGLGYRTQPQMTRRRATHVLEICDCVSILCRSCPGDGVAPYLYLDTTAGVIRPCECKTPRDRLARVHELFRNSNIPLKYRYQRLNDFNLQPQYPNPTKSPELETAKRYAQLALTAAFDRARVFIEAQKRLISAPHTVNASDLRGLFFIGPPGTGKSLLAAMILNELILTAELHCRYVKISRDFFQQLRSTFSNDSGTYGRTESVFNDIARQDILVIDDFGIQSDSEWEQRMLYDLIDARYESDLPTIVTSNIDLDSVKNLFKGRIYSRFTEMLHTVEFFQVRDYREDIQKNL